MRSGRRCDDRCLRSDQAQTARTALKWYGVDQLDFRRGVPDELAILDIQDGNPVTRRAESEIAPAGSPNPNYAGRGIAVRTCKALIVSAADRKAGDAAQVILQADWGRNWTSPGPLKPGRYLVVGMRARSRVAPGIGDRGGRNSLRSGGGFERGLRVGRIPNATPQRVSCAANGVERIMESLVQALPGASRTDMVRIMSFLRDSLLPADDRSATVGTEAPMGWEKSLYDLARRPDDPYLRAKSLEVLMQHHVENIEGAFATALMDCADDPDAFAARPPYRGLGPNFEQMGVYAQNRGDRDYWKRSPFDRARAIQVALNAKNDNIRYYLIDQVLWAPAPADWAGFVKLLREPPAPHWQDMLVRVFARWRGNRPTPKIEYGLVGGIRQITNMPELVEFYSKEYPDVRP